MSIDPADRLIRVLRHASPDDLARLVGELDVDRVLRALSGGFGHPDERPRLIRLLCVERVHDLEPGQLARVVHATRSIRNLESFSAAIRSVFESLTGDGFRDFKYALNAFGDRHDLEHVVFERLLPHDRRAVLRRIRAEAGTTIAPELRVLSDIDDTVVAMLHDRRYDRGTVVPGAEAFLTELDNGAAAQPDRPGDLTFVTARPAGPRGLIEQYTRGGLSRLDLPPHAVMGGSFLNIFTKSSIATRKLQNFDHERRLFPECRLVFVGDSGQADAIVGAAMLRRDPDFVARVYIHVVTPVSASRRRAWDARGITAFETYAGAARDAERRGLLSAEGATRVCDAVLSGIDGPGVRDRDGLREAARREAPRRDGSAGRDARG